MSNNNPEHPVFEYFKVIHIIQQLSKEKVERVLPNTMLMSHFNVLAHLCKHENGQTPAALANAFQVTRPSMSNTLSKLESFNFIDIIADPNDGRGKIVKITKLGIKNFQIAIKNIGPVFEKLINDVGLELFEKGLPDLKKVSTYLDDNR